MELLNIFPLLFKNKNKCILYQEVTNLTTGEDATWKEIKKAKERKTFLSGNALDCTVTVGLHPPRVGIDCKSTGKNSVLEGTAAQEWKVEWKMENVNYY